MNTYTNQVDPNDLNNEDGFIQVQRKSRFNALAESAKSKQPSQLSQSQTNFSPVADDLAPKRILFKRKEPSLNVSLSAPILNKPITMQVLSPKKLMVLKKKEPEVNINSKQLFPDLNEKPKTVVQKTSTVWNTFKASQLDITKIPTSPPIVVKQVLTSDKPPSKKVKSSSSSDDEQSHDEEYYDEKSIGDGNSDVYYDDYEETCLETLYNKQNNILNQLDELEQNGRLNSGYYANKYRNLQIELAEVNHDINIEEYYEQQIENENYERLNQVLLGNYYPLFNRETDTFQKEKEKETEMRERKARIEIIGYDDYDQFQLKLEDDLKKLRNSDLFYKPINQ